LDFSNYLLQYFDIKFHIPTNQKIIALFFLEKMEIFLNKISPFKCKFNLLNLFVYYKFLLMQIVYRLTSNI